METIKIFEKKENLNWEYDEEADVLYISIGKPKPSESIDIGEGTIIRFNPKTKEITGITLTNLSKRITKKL